MIDQRIGLQLGALVVCEVPAFVLCYRWFQLVEAARKQNRQLSRAVTNRLYQILIVMILVTLPALILLLEILQNWPVSISEAEAPLLLLPVLAGLLIVIGICYASFIMISHLVRTWNEFRCAYFLPDDADQVLLTGICRGIIDAAIAYPDPLTQQEEEVVDFLVRAGEVKLRAKRFPRQNQPWHIRLTNDFAHYCDLIRDGYITGYRRFSAECRDAADQLEELRQRLGQEEAMTTERALLDAYASRYLSLDK